eukprot:3107894-Prymnesium_polylepis.1
MLLLLRYGCARHMCMSVRDPAHCAGSGRTRHVSRLSRLRGRGGNMACHLLVGLRRDERSRGGGRERPAERGEARPRPPPAGWVARDETRSPLTAGPPCKSGYTKGVT